jgi:hypothetical protein
VLYLYTVRVYGGGKLLLHSFEPQRRVEVSCQLHAPVLPGGRAHCGH